MMDRGTAEGFATGFALLIAGGIVTWLFGGVGLAAFTVLMMAGFVGVAW